MHELLQQFVANDDVRILGPSQANLAQIATIFVRVIGRGTELLKEENVQDFQRFFFTALLPVMQKQGFGVQQAAQNLAPADQQRFVAAASTHGVTVQ